MCLKKDVRLVRRAKVESGCSSLQEFLLLAAQVKSVPRKTDLCTETDTMRRLEVGQKVNPEYEIPKFVISAAQEVLHGNHFLRDLRAATQSSGRALTA